MKYLSILTIASALFLLSCAASNKGDWSYKDKRLAKKEIAKVKGELKEVLGSLTDKYIDCYLEKVINHYPNFYTADRDTEGCTRLAKQCMQEINAN